MKVQADINEYAEGVLQGDRIMLAKAITLVESTLTSDRLAADELLDRIYPKSGNSIRVGITGVPGVGKSTFIESLGRHIIQVHQKKVAVLSVDPSSPVTRGSILGDKTRMDELSRNPMAFIRPSSSGETLGGITNRTREVISLCEAAGFDVVLVETVGVGQSEIAVRKVVDFFLLLLLAGAGDELQGIKKGIFEMADTIVVTKADGDNIEKARSAQADYQHALHLLRPDESGWIPKVLTCSALTGSGIDEVWNTVREFLEKFTSNSHFEKRRMQQLVDWMHECFYTMLKQEIASSERMATKVSQMESDVLNKKKLPPKAAQEMLEAFAAHMKSEF